MLVVLGRTVAGISPQSDVQHRRTSTCEAHRPVSFVALLLRHLACTPRRPTRRRRGRSRRRHRSSSEIAVIGPGSGTPGQAGDAAARPLVQYLVSWSVDPTPAQTGSLERAVRGSRRYDAAHPSSGSSTTSSAPTPTGAIVDDRFECIAFPNGDPTQRPPVPRGPRGPDVRRGVEQRAAARARRHARSRDARHHRSRHAHLDRRADDRRRSRRPSAATRSPAPRRSTTTRSASTGKPPTDARHRALHVRDEGQPHDRGRARSGTASPRSPGPISRPGCPRSTSATRRSRRRARIPSTRSARSSNPDRGDRGAGTVSDHVVGRRAALPRQRELLRSRAVAALLHRGSRARRSARAPRRRRRNRARRSGSTARAGTRRSCSARAATKAARSTSSSGTNRAPVGAPPAQLIETGFQRLGAAGARSRRHDRARRARSAVSCGASRSRTRSRRRRDPPRARGRSRRHRDRADRGRAGGAVVRRDHVRRPRTRRARSTRRSASARSRATRARTPTVRTCASTDRSRWTRSCSPRPAAATCSFMLVGFRTPRCERVRAARREHARHVARRVPRRRSRRRGREARAPARSTRSRAPVTMAMGPGLPSLRFVCFRGPDDEVVELIEQPTP